MDSMDTFIAIAKLPDPSVHDEVTSLFTRFYNGQVHPSIVPFFNSTYLFCLEKDPHDKSKLRPIGVPTAIRRLLASHIAKTSRVKFARHLLPYNYAIGVPGGMDFIVKAIQLQVDRFITQPQLLGDSPTRCLISLDLRNMFNEISRDDILDIIAIAFPEFLPLATMLYNECGDVWLKLDTNEWTAISMEEGANQGCPPSSTFAALVLHTVIAPIATSLHQRAAARLASGDPGDDGLGGVSDPMAYVDDKNICIYLPDVSFFFSEFQCLAPSKGLLLNSFKTRILTSTSGESAIPAITTKFGPSIASDLQASIATYSSKPCPTASNPTATTPVEVTTGLRVLGQPVGSPDFCRDFLSNAIDNVEKQVDSLFQSIDDRATLLRLFATCAMHKTPHLLGSEVLYFMDQVNPDSWDNWTGPLAHRIHSMAKNFLSRLTNNSSIPTTSMLIAYITVAQGGLGLMDPHTRAIPDFVVTMCSAIRAATTGFYMGANEKPIHLPVSLSNHFSNIHNLSSPILHRFYKFLPQLAARATPDGVQDPISHFVLHTSTKSARDRIRQEASFRRHHTLRSTASDDLRLHLPELLIASSSYPLIAMSRSNKSHRIPSDLFSISLKRKLHLDIYPSANLPTCICGAAIDPKGHHVFNCKKVSKWGCHNRIRDGLVPILTNILKTAQVIHPSSCLTTEAKNIIPTIPNCRPFDISFRPDSNPAVYDRAPCPFSEIGFDVTVTPSKSHLSPSLLNAVPTNSAVAADQHLRKKEKAKLQRAGMIDSSSTYVSGNDIIGTLLDANMVLIPIAVSPLGTSVNETGHLFRFGYCPYFSWNLI
jgi:hypothetical protein